MLTSVRWRLWAVGLAGCANTASGTAGTAMDAATDARADVSRQDAVDVAVIEDVPPPPPPPPFRLRSPISNHAIGTSRPILRWFSPDPTAEHVVTICADRRCTTVQDRQTVRGLSAQPTRDLPRGLHYWSVSTTREGASVETARWMFRTTWTTDAEPRTDDRGSSPDYNGDGYSDVVFVRDDSSDPEVIYGGRGELMTTPLSSDSTPGERVAQLCGAADFNGDGFDDLAVWVSSGQGYMAAVLLGSEAGLSGQRRVFIPPRTPVARRISSARNDLRRGDLDQDGYEELVDRDTVYLALNDMHVRLIWGGAAQISWERRSDSDDNLAVILDINADGLADLTSMRDVLGPGYRTVFGPVNRRSPWVYSDRRDLTDVTFCDLDRDRVPDLVGRNPDSRFELYGITAWLRSPDGREMRTLPVRGMPLDIHCFGASPMERVVYTDFVGRSIVELRVSHAAGDQSPRINAVQLVAPSAFANALYPYGPSSSFVISRDDANLVVLRDDITGHFFDVLMVEPNVPAITAIRSVRISNRFPVFADALL